MKKYIFIGLLLLCAKTTWAQRHEVGIKAGLSNVVGDLGKTDYLYIPKHIDKDLPFSIGVSYKRNVNPYQGIKLSLGYHHIYGYDIEAQETYRKNRRTAFSNDVLEGALTFEYNFFPINNELRESSFSPYIFGGVSGIYYDTPALLFTVSNNSSNTGYTITTQPYASKKRFSWGVPFGLGLKYKLDSNWAIYGEATFRPTFTDELDFNNIENMEYTIQYQGIPDADLDNANRALDDFINKNYKIGNLNSKDWLNSITIGISYSFGRPPCYCN